MHKNVNYYFCYIKTHGIQNKLCRCRIRKKKFSAVAFTTMLSKFTEVDIPVNLPWRSDHAMLKKINLISGSTGRLKFKYHDFFGRVAGGGGGGEKTFSSRNNMAAWLEFAKVHLNEPQYFWFNVLLTHKTKGQMFLQSAHCHLTTVSTMVKCWLDYFFLLLPWATVIVLPINALGKPKRLYIQIQGRLSDSWNLDKTGHNAMIPIIPKQNSLSATERSKTKESRYCNGPVKEG